MRSRNLSSGDVREAESWFEPERRRKLVLRPGRERAVANRHPWIFSGSVAQESGPEEAALGDLHDGGGALLASGLYSPHSQIRLRALTFGGETLSVNTLQERLREAINRRGSILAEGTTAVRLVHSEGDDLSGLVVDQYGEILVCEVTSYGLEKLRPLLVEVLQRLRNPRGIYFKNDIPARRAERLGGQNEQLGDVPEEIEISENAVRFVVSPRQGQKTGFFLDQRDNRALARRLAKDRRVLNLFSYSGGFGVYAALGGATMVQEVDLSAPAIDLARRNHSLNNTGSVASFVLADAFEYVRDLAARESRFELIVCDPPAFAKSRGEVDRAARGYKDINLNALKLVAKGGQLMTFSCSGHISLDLFQKVIFAAALDAGRRVSFLRRLEAGSDHPVSLFCPESEYLKGFLLQIHE